MPAAVPTMKTWADGSRVRTTDLNGQIRDAIGFVLDPPQTCVYRTTSTSLPSGTTAILNTWEAALYDNNAGWSLSTNPSRITINTAGKYLVDAKYQWGNYGGGAGFRSLYIRANAAGNPAVGSVVDLDYCVPTVAAASQVRVQMVRAFSVGEHLEMFIWQNSGATQPTTTGVLGGYLSVRWVAP